MDVPPSAEERKVVTVLFADLVDSTAWADGRDPEDVRALLRPLHRRMREELERYGGTVEKFIGDAVMALFGAPVAHEDDAERAVRAALALHEAVAALDGEVRLRIGVATGEALVDLEAVASRGEGLAAGADVVNTGFRIAAAASPDGILVDETTYYATRDGIEYREREAAPAKGKREPVPVWEVEAVRAQRATPRLPPFVGRKRELAALKAALEAARSERAVRLVTILGVPGIGKSRLVRELRTETADEVTWLRGRSLPYGEETAYGALADMVKSFAGIRREDGPEGAEEKLRSALPAALEPAERAWVEGQVRALAGLEAGPPPSRDQTFAGWRRLLEAIAAERPLAVVFEDLHWADDGLLEFVDHLVGWSSSAPLLVVCTARPELLERHPGWGRAYDNAETISVGPLTESQTLELLTATADESLPEHVEAVVVGRVDGNPLYAQEYVRMLVERGSEPAPAALPLPESVQAVIAARMDGLPPEEKALVHDAAVVGRTTWVGALAALSGLPRYTVGERLDSLERKEFLRREAEVAVAGETSYAFQHVLVRDVAYAQIPRAARAEKHAHAARWLETVANRREDLAELIARHYQRALELTRASGGDDSDLVEPTRRALEDAGQRALRLNAHAAVAQFFGAALELAGRDGAERLRLELAYGKGLARSEQVGEDVLVAARDGFLARGERAAAADAELELADLFQAQGRHDEQYEALVRASGLLEHEESSEAKARALSKLSAFLLFGERHDEAAKVGFEALTIAEELDLPLVRAYSLTNLGFVRASHGDRAGIVDLERSIAISLEHNSPEALRGYINLGTVLANFGELEAAFERYRAGLALAQRFGDARGILWFTSEGLYESYWTGRWDEALETIDRLADERVLHATRFDSQLVRGWIRLARDETEAIDDADAVVADARGGQPQYLFPALSFRARVLASLGRDDEAAEAVRETLEQWGKAETTYASFWLADLAVAARAVGLADELVRALDGLEFPSRWIEAAACYAAGRYDEAAALYDSIGSRPDAAYARLQTGDARALEDARRFFRSVGARSYAEVRS